MPINASIPLQGRQLQLDNPMDNYAKMVQIQGYQKQNKLADLAYGEKQGEISNRNALNEAYKQSMTPEGSIDRNKLLSSVVQAGQGTQLPIIQKGFADQDKAIMEAQNTKIENHLKQLDAVGQIMSTVQDQASYDAAKQEIIGVLGPAAAANIPQVYNPQIIEQGRQKAMSVANQLMEQHKQIEEQLKAKEFANTQANNANTQANKPFSAGPNGESIPNIPVQNYEIGKSRAGAANTDIKINTKMGEGLAKEIGPMMAASKSSAEGAIQQLDVSKTIDAALNSGTIIAGPGANFRTAAAQIAQVMGIGGQNNDEVLANTRTVIQSLAKFTLTGRSSLKGQGQISDYEGKLLARATSGDIQDLTIPEIKVINNAAKRVALAQSEAHQKNMQIMRSKPELKDMADFYDVSPANNQQQANPIDSLLEKYK